MSKFQENQISLIILGGGKSTRFGSDKSQYKINGISLVETLYNRLKHHFSETIIVSNYKNKFSLSNIHEVVDIYPGRGPVGGLHAGLVYSKTPYSMVIACDMPFIGDRIIESLIQATERTHAEAIVPRHEEGVEPLCAFYRRDLIGILEDRLVNKDIISVHQLLNEINTCYVAFEGCAEDFFNMNTPQDKTRLFKKRVGSTVSNKYTERAF